MKAAFLKIYSEMQSTAFSVDKTGVSSKAGGSSIHKLENKLVAEE